MRMVTEKDNETLGLSADDIFQLGQRNLDAALQPLMQVAKPVRSGQIGQLVGNVYDPSRLAQPAAWKPLADAQKGILIVTAPAKDAVFYIGEASPIAIDALRTLARNVMARAPGPLSDVLLRWTPGGWQVVP